MKKIVEVITQPLSVEAEFEVETEIRRILALEDLNELRALCDQYDMLLIFDAGSDDVRDGSTLDKSEKECSATCTKSQHRQFN